jgi:hypothetical protein
MPTKRHPCVQIGLLHRTVLMAAWSSAWAVRLAGTTIEAMRRM